MSDERKVWARCKFRVNEVTTLFPDSEENKDEKIRLYTQYDPDDPEDTAFSLATPAGSIEIFLSNPKLLGQAKVGQVYYVDLIPVDG